MEGSKFENSMEAVLLSRGRVFDSQGDVVDNAGN